MSCISDFSQPFPQTGQNLNLSLNDLRRKIGKTPATVYSYIVATVKNSEGHFIQTGSAPNFQDDVISLCTCKHRMRTSLDKELWIGTWVAGFTGKKEGKGKNALIYLMKVGIAFESYYDLWNSKEISWKTKQDKLAHKDKFGDIFKPKDTYSGPFDYQSYEPPCEEHSHYKDDKWHNDIDYKKGYKERKPALLIGDKQYSFLWNKWNKPMLFYPRQLSRGYEKVDLQRLLDSFRDKGEL
jgi:hypothetical protein